MKAMYIKHILSKQLWVEAIDNVRIKGKIWFHTSFIYQHWFDLYHLIITQSVSHYRWVVIIILIIFIIQWFIILSWFLLMHFGWFILLIEWIILIRLSGPHTDFWIDENKPSFKLSFFKKINFLHLLFFIKYDK